MELCPKGDNEAKTAGKTSLNADLGYCYVRKKNIQMKKNKLTSSQKAQSHMMVAKALLS